MLWTFWFFPNWTNPTSSFGFYHYVKCLVIVIVVRHSIVEKGQ